MSTSGSANWALNRDEVIKLALRRVNAIGEGETPSAAAVTDAAVTLNALVKEWQGDGMPLWKLSTFVIPATATNEFIIGVGYDLSIYPPQRIHQGFYRNNTTNIDSPLLQITRDEYNRLSDKNTLGTPSQFWYQPPGNQGGTSNEPFGIITLYQGCSASFIASNSVQFVGEFLFEDFDASTDYPDFPSYWNNALAWALAYDIGFDYGVTPSRLSQIEKRADKSKMKAIENSAEWGSIFIQPARQYGR